MGAWEAQGSFASDLRASTWIPWTGTFEISLSLFGVQSLARQVVDTRRQNQAVSFLSSSRTTPTLPPLQPTVKQRTRTKPSFVLRDAQENRSTACLLSYKVDRKLPSWRFVGRRREVECDLALKIYQNLHAPASSSATAMRATSNNQLRERRTTRRFTC